MIEDNKEIIYLIISIILFLIISKIIYIGIVIFCIISFLAILISPILVNKKYIIVLIIICLCSIRFSNYKIENLKNFSRFLYLDILNIKDYESSKEIEFCGVIKNIFKNSFSVNNIELNYKDKTLNLPRSFSFLVSNKLKKEIEKNSKVYIKGYLKRISSSENMNMFSFSKFCKKEKIYGYCNSLKIISYKNKGIISSIRRYIDSRYNNFFDKKCQVFAKAVLIGEKNLNNELFKKFQKIGVSHLTTISGLHMSFIAGMIFFISLKIFNNKKIASFISIIAIIFYSFIVGAKVSIIRSASMSIISLIAILFNRRSTILRIFFIVLFTHLLFLPDSFFYISFQFSYIAVLSIILISSVLNKYSIVIRIILLQLSVQLCLLPIVLNNFGKISIYSILANLILINLMPIILFILIMYPILFFVPGFKYLVNILTSKYINIAYFFAELPDISFEFHITNIEVIFIYSIILLIIFKYYRSLYFLIIFIFIFEIFYYSVSEIVFFDVGDGDSFLIRKGFYALIIDGGIYSEYSNPASNYCLKEHLRNIDIILTHEHIDHYGGFKNFIEDKLNISKVFVNTDSLKRRLKKYSHIAINVLPEIKFFNNSPIEFVCLNSSKLFNYNNENNRSIITFIKTSKGILFTAGDIYSSIEDIIVDILPKNILMLKASHHGSNTSSSTKFLTKLNPKISIISSGNNPRYKHPSNIVLKRLTDISKTYLTESNGAIRFFFIGNYIISIYEKR